LSNDAAAPGEREDRALVDDCLAGDMGAFEILVDRYQKILFNVAYRMTGDYDDARDITQTAFLKIYENLPSFNPQFKFYSWIYRIAINESLNWIKKKRPQETPDVNLVAPGNRPDQDYEEDQTSRTIQTLLQNLSPDYRTVLVLRHFMDLSYRDMSQALHVPEKTIKSRLFTARRLLGDLLRERGIGGPTGSGGRSDRLLNDPDGKDMRRLQG
jgi:RNA polymerase sigma-70 factor (ECF subfamily)